jgi:hypothetical protein
VVLERVRLSLQAQLVKMVDKKEEQISVMDFPGNPDHDIL